MTVEENVKATVAGLRANLRAVLIEVNEVGAVALRVGRRVGRLVGREVHESGYAVS